MAPKKGDPKPWYPLIPCERVPISEEKIRAFAAELEALGQTADEALATARAQVEPEVELWKNLHVTVTVERYEDGAPRVIHVRRNDRKPIRDWRVLQRVKNEIAGPEAEAVELYPRESRLVDTANSYWLWVAPKGQEFAFGFEERAVDYDEDRAARMGARQRKETLSWDE